MRSEVDLVPMRWDGNDDETSYSIKFSQRLTRTQKNASHCPSICGSNRMIWIWMTESGMDRGSNETRPHH